LALAAVVVQPALAAPMQCATGAEFHAGARFVMPILIDGATKKCQPLLGSGSYLATKGPALAQRYAALPGDDSTITALVGKLDPKGDMKGLDAAALKGFATVAVAKGMGDDLKPSICPTIDKVLALLDPLPAENTIGLIEVILRQVDDDNVKKAERAGKPPKRILCPGS
jgi:hypothetical protein